MGPPFAGDDDFDAFKDEALAALEASTLTTSRGAPASRDELVEVLSYLFACRTYAFVPQTEPAPPCGLEPRESKIGGVPLIRAHDAWPTSLSGEPLCHLLQAAVRELPREVQRALGAVEGTGLLQVFVADALDDDEPAPADDGGGGGGGRAGGSAGGGSSGGGEEGSEEEEERAHRGGRRRSGAGSWFRVRVVRDPHPHPHHPHPHSEAAAGQAHGGGVGRDLSGVPDGAELLDEKRITGWSREADFPCTEDVLAGLPAGLDPHLAEQMVDSLHNAGLVTSCSGDKLLGWPRWCQGPEWCETPDGKRYLQVVQVEGMDIPFPVGDSGTLVLQRHPTDASRWGASWACC